MADIPVERKEGGSFPWWLIPLVLLLLLLPLLYFCSKTNVVDNTNNNINRIVNTNANRVASGNMSNTAVVVNSNNASMSDNDSARGGAVIKDVGDFGTTSDKSTLVGRGVFVNDVRVNRVLSDNVFTVKSGSSEMFVMLDEKLDSPGGKEGQIRMRRGQNVNLGGEFRAIPAPETKEENKDGGLNNKEYAQMKGQRVYLHATSVSDAK